MIVRATAVFLSLVSLSFGQTKLTPQEQKDGFQLLFDGTAMHRVHIVKRRPNPSSWTIVDGVLSYEKGESWLATDDTYIDFVVRMDYKTADKCDSGIYINASAEGNPGTTGLEFNLVSDNGKPATARSTASISAMVAPAKNLNKPDGEWNTLEISVVDRHLTAIVNGEKVQDLSLDDPQYAGLATRGKSGHVGIQAHAFGEPASFRNIRIKPVKLGPPDPPAAAPAPEK